MIDARVDADIRLALAAEGRWQRRQQAALLRHPDPRDPDHPGCHLCDHEGEEETCDD